LRRRVPGSTKSTIATLDERMPECGNDQRRPTRDEQELRSSDHADRGRVERRFALVVREPADEQDVDLRGEDESEQTDQPCVTCKPERKADLVAPRRLPRSPAPEPQS